MTDHLLKGTVLKGKYTVESLMENSDFSNIYTGKAGNKDIIIKECFPKSLVIRGSDNEVFTIKHGCDGFLSSGRNFNSVVSHDYATPLLGLAPICQTKGNGSRFTSQSPMTFSL